MNKLIIGAHLRRLCAELMSGMEAQKPLGAARAHTRAPGTCNFAPPGANVGARIRRRPAPGAAPFRRRQAAPPDARRRQLERGPNGRGPIRSSGQAGGQLPALRPPVVGLKKRTGAPLASRTRAGQLHGVCARAPVCVCVCVRESRYARAPPRHQQPE